MEFKVRITAVRTEGMTLSNDTVREAIVEELQGALSDIDVQNPNNDQTSNYSVEIEEA